MLLEIEILHKNTGALTQEGAFMKRVYGNRLPALRERAPALEMANLLPVLPDRKEKVFVSPASASLHVIVSTCKHKTWIG